MYSLRVGRLEKDFIFYFIFGLRELDLKIRLEFYAVSVARFKEF